MLELAGEIFVLLLVHLVLGFFLGWLWWRRADAAAVDAADGWEGVERRTSAGRRQRDLIRRDGEGDDLEAIRAKLGELSAQKAAIAAERDELRAALDARGEGEAEVARLQAELAAAREQLAAVEERADARARLAEQVGDDDEEAQDGRRAPDPSVVARELDRLRDENTRLVRQLHDARSARDAVATQVLAAKRQQAAAIGQAGEADRRHEEAGARLARLREELAAALASNDQLLGRVAELEVELGSARREAREATTRRRELEEEVAAVRRDRGSEQEHYAELVRDRDVLRQQVRRADMRVKDLDDLVTRLQAQLAEVAARPASDGITVPDIDPSDLTRVSGIGRKLAKLLEEQGIRSLHDLAGLAEHEVDELQARLPAFPNRVRRERWVEQARELVGAPSPA